jgi:predicted MFS family arabinose efflux permease
MVFSFGPAMLTERSWSMTAAGSAMSLVIWIAAVSVPLGGFIADRTGKNDAILLGGCALFAAIMVATPRSEAMIAVVTALGLVSGLAAGPILSLPARVPEPSARAICMGVYYLGMMAGTALGGTYAAWFGSASGAFDFGAAMLLACMALLCRFHRIAPRNSLPSTTAP